MNFQTLDTIKKTIVRLKSCIEVDKELKAEDVTDIRHALIYLEWIKDRYENPISHHS